MTTKTGGPAFPIVAIETNQYGIVFPYVEPGMTLRDWFAGQALSTKYSVRSSDPAIEIAQWVYDVADAMLVIREKVKEQSE